MNRIQRQQKIDTFEQKLCNNYNTINDLNRYINLPSQQLQYYMHC